MGKKKYYNNNYINYNFNYILKNVFFFLNFYILLYSTQNAITKNKCAKRQNNNAKNSLVQSIVREKIN